MNTLDSVVDALAKDPARKFVVVEQVSIQYSTVQYLPSLPDILLSLSSTLC
jgi:alpha-mannosidase